MQRAARHCFRASSGTSNQGRWNERRGGGYNALV